MGFIIYGIQKATIGIDEFLMNCPSCETGNFANIMFTSNYFHIYFIPVFPVAKEVNIICQKCGLKRYNVPFSQRLFPNYHEIKHKVKHPLYTYSFVLFIGVIVLFAVIISVIKKDSLSIV